MTPNQQREELSRAYVAAIAAKLAYKVGTWSQDDDSLDVTLSAPGVIPPGTLAGPKIDIQLKCTSDAARDKGDYVACQLKRANYEALRAVPACAPRLLVVLMLPPTEDEWVSHTPEVLELRRCAYWINLANAPALDDAAVSTTVQVPKNNVFSPDALKDLMAKVSAGELP